VLGGSCGDKDDNEQSLPVHKDHNNWGKSSAVSSMQYSLQSASGRLRYPKVNWQSSTEFY